MNFEYKLRTGLVTEYDAVFVEDLDVKPMLEDSQNARNKQTPLGDSSSHGLNTRPTCMAVTSSK